MNVVKTQTEIQKIPEPISSSIAFVKTLQLQEHEEKMLVLKYQSQPLGKMGAVEQLKHTKALLLKIHVITGWNLPADEFMNILVDQFQKKIVECYPNANTHEIEHAFRTRGTLVKDWGKQMNLSLFDAVMIPYLNDRYELSKAEQAAIKPKELPVPPMTDQEIVDTAWDVWNTTGKLDYISESCYEVLVKHSILILSVEQKTALMVSANSYLQEMLQTDPELFKRSDRPEMQKRYAKKIAVAMLFEQYKADNQKIILL